MVHVHVLYTAAIYVGMFMCDNVGCCMGIPQYLFVHFVYQCRPHIILISCTYMYNTDSLNIRM